MPSTGTLYPDVPPPPNAATTPQKDTNGQPAPPSLPPGVNGAIMDAADAPPPPAAAATQVGKAGIGDTAPQNATGAPELPMPSVPGTGAPKNTTAQDEPEIAMPEVRKKADQAGKPPVVIPQIPDAPPTPPAFPGYEVPSDTGLADGMHPNYDLTDVRGTPFHFVSQSDLLAAGQDGTFTKLLSTTPHGPFYVHGFGDAASQSVQDQADAVRLGLLRASRVAQALVSRGVPASAIHVRGDAFGTGAMVSTTP